MQVLRNSLVQSWQLSQTGVTVMVSLHACKLDNTGNCISGDVIPRIVQLASMRIAQELCACHGNSVVGPGVHYVALGELLHHV